MADDIDIEEHDVLESLRRRQQPDTSIIKSEPVELEYDESNYGEPSNYEWEWEKDKVEIKVEPHTDEFRFGKIILGSKPAKLPQEKEHETAEDSQDAESVSEEEYNYNMSLVLDDWGPILERSDCYCKICETLFATVNALDAHKMIAHSFLVATDKQPSPERNKAIKSTAKPSSSSSVNDNTCQICHFHFKGTVGRSNLYRHYKNVHKLDRAVVKNSDFKSWRVCNHCNLYFPDDTSLVKHLYELLPLNDKTPTKDDKKTVGTVKPKPTKDDKKPVRPVTPKPALIVDKIPKTVKPTCSKTLNVKPIISPIKKDVTSSEIPIPNKIILGSKPMAVKTENVNQTEDPNKKKCEICSVECVSKYYLIHMKRFHPDFLKKQKQPNKIILGDTKARYKCLVCNEILTTEYRMKKHRSKHPTMKGRRVCVKLVNKINTMKAKPNLIKKEKSIKTPNVVKMVPAKAYLSKLVNNEVVNENKLVSKSILFKCNRCSVHFLTCTGACKHSIVCETSSNIRDWACPQCQRVFKNTDRSAHEYQHKMLKANTFKVYVVYLEMIVRILCQCPNCGVCFEEDKFWTHVNGGCQDAGSYFCNECKLPIDIHAKANHDSKHKQGDFTKEDFIKIDYISFKADVLKKIKTEVEEVTSPAKVKIELDATKRGVKRKYEMISKVEVPQKKKKNFDELLLFYCQVCKSFLANKSLVHVSGGCRARRSGQRAFCKYCGIYLKYKYHTTHMALHSKIPNLTIADFTFLKLSDSKKIKPVQELYPCKSCKVNFFSKRAKMIHRCDETASNNCQICQKKIQADTFKTHMQIHNYMIPRQVKTISEMMAISAYPTKSPVNQLYSKISQPKSTQNLNKELPDLLMKYQSLTALWNIVYLCAICDTFTDSYDKVVEHCQNHLTNMENYGVVIMKCEKCDMKFDSECYKRHLELHAGTVISKKTFQILKYEHYNLFSKSWFDFLDVPEEQKSQIVKRSIYGENRCVKMKLIQQGLPEYTLYKCEKCLNCIVADGIVYHVKLANCLKANKIKCSSCNMTFASRRDYEEHERIHQSTGLRLQSFRIVSFNDANDSEANATIMSYDTENRGSKSKISFVDDEFEPKPTNSGENSAPAKSFVFYKCGECLTCVAHIKNFPSHACNTNKKRQCNECGIHYNAKQFSRHQILHRRYKFSRKNVIIKTLNKDGKVINIKKQTPEKKSTAPQIQDVIESADLKSKLYKCFCGLHYTSLKSIEKHYKMKNCSTVVREKCSQCYLVFDPIEVVNHLCKHHAQNQVQTFNIVTPNKKALYKCGLCHVLFYNKAVAIPHKAKCAGIMCGRKCEKCGLAFDASSIATHMVDHERNNKLKNDCYVIVKIPDDNIVLSKGVYPNTLYKCQSCDIHFLRRTSARNHMLKRTHCHTTVAQTCKICQRKFPAKSIVKHVAWQHNKLKIKEFDVIELAVGVNTKLPKDDKKEEIVKPKVKKEVEVVVPKTKIVNVTMHKCNKCTLLFTDKSTLVTHLEDRCSKELTDECEECDVKISSKNIKEHNRLHAPGVEISITVIENVQNPDDIEIVRKVKPRVPCEPKDILDRYDNKLFKCTACEVHYLTLRSLESHAEKGRQQCNLDFTVKCEECDIAFTSYSLKRHKLIHEKYNFRKEDFVIHTLAGAVKLPQSENLGMERNEDPTQNLKEYSLDKYDNKLYKCASCNLHYLTHATLMKHDNCNPNIGVKCEECDLAFTTYSLRRHKLIHEKFNFKKEDFVIVSGTEDVKVPQTPDDVHAERKVKRVQYKLKKLPAKYTNKLYKCTGCNVHYLTHSTLLKHTICIPGVGLKCEVCDIAFTGYSLTRHMQIHEKYNFKKDDFVVLTLADLESNSSQSAVDTKSGIEEDISLDSSSETIETPETKEEPKKEANTSSTTHFLYKCVECNIYYTTRVSCHKHIAKHTPLDPKEYIECKLCSFQFTIMGLPAHIKKHHERPFKLEEILVEEYQPNDIKTHETYYASEKDQSTLVSTSEDVRNDSNLREENDCEVSSCNEIAEKLDSSDNNSILDITDVDLDIRKEGQSSSDLKTDSLVESNAIVDSSENNTVIDAADEGDVELNSTGRNNT